MRAPVSDKSSSVAGCLKRPVPTRTVDSGSGLRGGVFPARSRPRRPRPGPRSASARPRGSRRGGQGFRGPARTRTARPRVGSRSRGRSPVRCWTHSRSRASLARESSLPWPHGCLGRGGRTTIRPFGLPPEAPPEESGASARSRRSDPAGASGEGGRSVGPGEARRGDGYERGRRESGFARRKSNSRPRDRGACQSRERARWAACQYVEYPGLAALESADFGRAYPERPRAVAPETRTTTDPGRRARRPRGSASKPSPQSGRGARATFRDRPHGALPGALA